MGALLEIEGLRKAFGDTVALDGVSFSVEQGQVMGLLGPNGAGKTTAVSCVTGVLAPDAGEIRIDGTELTSDPISAKASMGVAAQSISLYPDLPVETNFRFWGDLNGLSRAALASAIDDVAERLDLGDKLRKRVRDLSVGQQRLVHVATALLHRPPLLILDEPTAGLDVGARALLLSLLDDIARSGVALLYSSHYLKEVEDLCDDVVMLDRGEVLARGSVAALIAAHGKGRVEMVVDGEVHIEVDTDVPTAVDLARNRGAVESVRVVSPSLEAVYIDLTGTTIDEAGTAETMS
jgi:ABC-2 type transport system ATP-binding protein